MGGISAQYGFIVQNRLFIYWLTRYINEKKVKSYDIEHVSPQGIEVDCYFELEYFSKSKGKKIIKKQFLECKVRDKKIDQCKDFSTILNNFCRIYKKIKAKKQIDFIIYHSKDIDTEVAGWATIISTSKTTLSIEGSDKSLKNFLKRIKKEKGWVIDFDLARKVCRKIKFKEIDIEDWFGKNKLSYLKEIFGEEQGGAKYRELLENIYYFIEEKYADKQNKQTFDAFYPIENFRQGSMSPLY